MSEGHEDEPESVLNQDQMRQELVQLNCQIQNLQHSEDQRLARELQAIELDIQQAQINVVSVSLAALLTFSNFATYFPYMTAKLVY